MKIKKAMVLAATMATAASTAAVPAAQAANDATNTLDHRIVRQGNGFQNLAKAAGEKYTVRKELARAKNGRAGRRESLAFFGQLTDPQIVDTASPVRTELVDPASGPIAAAWRPQEALNTRVFDAVIKGMNENKVSRVRQANGKKAKLAFSLLTGDFADNAQLNEVHWFRDVLNGKTFAPHSGKAISASNACPVATPDQVAEMNAEVAGREYVGVQDYDDWPGQNLRYPGFWDPNVGGLNDVYGYGDFPIYESLMNASQAEFTPAGLKMPWYITPGNHDILVQGNVPASLEVAGLSLRDLAVGCLKPWPNNDFDPSLLHGIDSADVFDRITQPDMIGGLLYGLLNMRRTAPDPERQFVSRLMFKKALAGRDNGHGFGFVDKDELTASRQNATYYGFTKGKFRFIMLDSNAEGGGSTGNIDAAQYRWLKRELDRFSTVSVRNGKLVRDGGRNKLIVIGSHHTLRTMNNPTPDEAAGVCDDPMIAGCDSDPRKSTPLHFGTKGKQSIKDLVLQYPNVVAMINGHTHRNSLHAYKRAGSGKTGGGFWQINTASSIDWPLQSRTLEFMDNNDGTLSIFGTILNAKAPIAAPDSVANAETLADDVLVSIARRVSANDPQTDDLLPGGGDGTPGDRNAEMLLPDPRLLWTVRGLG